MTEEQPYYEWYKVRASDYDNHWEETVESLSYARERAYELRSRPFHDAHVWKMTMERLDD